MSQKMDSAFEAMTGIALGHLVPTDNGIREKNFNPKPEVGRDGARRRHRAVQARRSPRGSARQFGR
jgi:hypothetical protein